MSKHFFQNATLRLVLLKTYRAYARSMVWRQGPKVFINSIPKAGTHLATAIIEEVPGLMQSRLHIDMWDVHSGKERLAPIADFKADVARFKRLLSEVRAGQIATGHLPWNPEIAAALRDMNFKVVFITRSPKDIVNSNLHYIKGLKRIYIHERLMREYATDEERRDAIEKGIPPRFPGDPCLDSIADIFKAYDGWANEESSEKLVLAFEDLVGMRGGGSQEKRIDSIKKIVAHVGLRPDPSVVEEIERASRSKRSFTFRSGKIGEGKSTSQASNSGAPSK